MRLSLGVVVALSSTAMAQSAPGLLAERKVSAVLTSETDASADAFGDVSSLAPDLAVGVTDDLTLTLIHSQFGRTGFRGAAGTGLCMTDACASTYDNVGLEAIYSLRRGAFAIAADAGVHAWSLDRDHYVAKIGAKLRYGVGRLVFASHPSVTLAVTERETNKDRLWLPVTGMVTVVPGLSVGGATGLKGPIATLDEGYEIAVGALATYAATPAVTVGASWIHGKLFGGEMALPGDMQGRDSRVINVWVAATR